LIASTDHKKTTLSGMRAMLVMLVFGGTLLVMLFQSSDRKPPDTTQAGQLSGAQAVLFAGTQVPESAVPTYTACDAPCWRGIVPGKSTWQQAQAVVGRLPGYERAEWMRGDGRLVIQHTWSSGIIDTRYGWNTIKSVDGLVENIDLFYEQPECTLRDLVAKFGPPEQTRSSLFSVHDARWNVAFLYAGKGLLFGTDFERLKPESRVIYRSYFAPTTAEKYMSRVDDRSFTAWNSTWWEGLLKEEANN
jgi:hypothetical protein